MWHISIHKHSDLQGEKVLQVFFISINIEQATSDSQSWIGVNGLC